ncbi:MAG: acetyl esterase/lipase [Yoonia sp.]|jgi:acetyl esterase/lipase
MKGLNMDMDDRFANGAYIDGAADYPDRWNTQAAAFRRSVLAEIDVPYGPSPRQVMDIFHPNRLAKGLVVFVHGGYWRMFDKSVWSHLAAGPLARGWAVAIPSYDLCPDVRISDITAQMTAAVRLAASRVPGPIRLTGHSAGGQIVARLAGMDWEGRLARVVPISPVTDLKPLMLTKMQEDFQLTQAEAIAESPVHAPAPDVPVTVWVGADERPVFHEQAQALGAAWGCNVTFAPDQHHFNVIEGLADANSPLTHCLLS